MKILFIADLHIKLGQRKVPKDWQRNRFSLLCEEINGIHADLVIIGGDLLDVASPSMEELELMFDFLAKMNKKTLIFQGNHEMQSKTFGVLTRFADEIRRCNPLCEVVGSMRSPEFDIVSYEDLHRKWEPAQSRLLFTHVRAALPEHMKTKPEVDLSKFDEWELVITGDLHDHKMTQETDTGTPLVYPGSPLTTSFHRELSEDSNGIIIVDTDTLEWTWHNLKHLPQLIRKTITDPDEMIEDPYHRVVYELEGDVMDLKGTESSELLDKKINVNVSREAKLDLKDKTMREELQMYLEDVEGLPEDKVSNCMTRFANEVTTEEV